MPERDKDQTITGGLLGGSQEYEARQREKLFLLLNHFRSREELLDYLDKTQSILSTVNSITSALKGLDTRIKSLEDKTKTLEDELEEITEIRDRRAWLFGNLKSFTGVFLPLAAVLTILVQSWDWLIQYIRGGPTP